MQRLLDDSFDPITSQIGLIRAPLDVAARTLFEWESPLQAARGVRVSQHPVQGSLPEVLGALLPLTSVERTRELLLAGRNGWTAFFDNDYGGTDGAYVVTIARRIGCVGARAVWVPPTFDEQTGKGRPGGIILTVFRTEGGERGIQLLRDGRRWKFSAYGEPLPFENLERYQAKRPTGRFDAEMLVDYLAALGAEPFRREFYEEGGRATGVLTLKEGALSPNVRSWSLEEARRKWNG